MVFADLLFLFIFLPLCLLFYYSTGNASWRNWVLIIFSLAFYGWGEPVWISLLVLSSMVDWGNSLFIEKHRGTKWAKIGVAFTVIFNLCLLATFKYDVFLVDQLNGLLGTHIKAPNYHLPLGISFYTFHTISYVVDVYRGDIKAQKNFPNFLMYVSLFSSLVAGPIIRYAHVEKEIYGRKENLRDFSLGVSRFCIGLFKKVIIANIAAVLVAKYMGGKDHEMHLSDIHALSSMEAWVGLVMFALQIYFDFSGYSDMAVGLARMFGIRLPYNFNSPYKALSIVDFWRRWHISLSNWLRDYLYFSLPGKRSKIFTYVNLVITMIIGGLWHGANWNFVIWGALHGFGLAFVRLWQTQYGTAKAEASPSSTLWRYASIILTFHYVTFAWIFFRAPSFDVALAILGRLASLSVSFANVSGPLALVLIVGALAHYIPKKWYDWSLTLYVRAPFYAQAGALAALVLGLQNVVQRGAAPFIYTRF